MEDRNRRNVSAATGVRSAVRASAFALFVSMLAGCGDSTGPADLTGVTVAAPTTIHFTLEVPGGFRQIVVPVTITNSTAKRLNLGWCSTSLERFTGTKWESVWSPFCMATLGADTPIKPGETRTISVVVGDTPSQYSGFRFTDPQNVYRVRLELVLGGDDGTAALLTLGASNVFEVVP